MTDQSKATDTAAANKKIVELLFDLSLNQRDFDGAGKLISDDYKFNKKPSSRQANRDWIDSLHAAYPGLHFSFEVILAEKHLVALRWKMEAPAHGERPAGYRTGTNILEVVDGKVVSNTQNGFVSEGWPERK